MAIEHSPKAGFDAVPVIDFSLATRDREAYFKQLKFAVEDIGFGVSILIHLLPRDAMVLLKANRFSRTSRASKIRTRRRCSTWRPSCSISHKNGRIIWAL
jgi:hypothetical protein